MVGIVAVTRFCESGSSAFSSYIDYMDRSSAVRKDNLEKFNIFAEYMDYMDDETKKLSGEDLTIRKMSALFTRDADALSDDEKNSIKDLFMRAQTNGSNMWQTVVSFDNAYLEELGLYDPETEMLNEKLLRQASRRAIGDMLSSEGLSNATWTAAIHYNTDHIHIHIATVEPIPMREKRTYTLYERDDNGEYPRDGRGRPIKKPLLDENGKPMTYEAYKGTFKKKSIEALKSGIRNELEGSKEVHQDITRLLRDNILSGKKKKNLLDAPEFAGKMLSLYRDLADSGISAKNWHYNMNLISGYRAKIDDLSDFFIKTYYRDDFNDFVAQIEAEAARQTKAYGGAGSNYADNMLYGKEGLYARLGNTILKEVREYDKTIKSQRREAKAASDMLRPESESYNPEKALQLLKSQADSGNTYAQNSLGILYLQGKHVARDPARARALFLSSAKKGNEFGKSMLRRMEKGEKTPERIASRRLFASVPGRDIRRGLRTLEQNLKFNYMKMRNLQEHAELERKIEERGMEEEL